MFIQWKLNDEIIGLTLDEFEKDYIGIYGFMMLELGDYRLGYIDKLFELDEGDETVGTYINCLIECGIAILTGKCYEQQLYNSNLLKIYVKLNKKVDINVKHIDSNEIKCAYSISLSELIDEIKDNYCLYIQTIEKMNDSLLESRIIKRTKCLYKVFNDVLDDYKHIHIK